MDINWEVFRLKYDKKETWAFEQMSYLLFCAEMGNRIGLFRYKNQTGIETEPIEKEGIFYGFQAKYYTTSIAGNKADIIDSIEKAKSKNSKLNELLLYVNQELSESTTKDKKEPQYQLDIEKAAKAVGVNIQWRVPSHFEIQLSEPDNKYLYDIFFNLNPNEGDLLDEVSKHNENILQAIQTEIPFGDKKIKIDRCTIIEKLTKASQEKKNIIISGEGGCGKTSVFKEFYSLNFKEIPICVFKATAINVDHINDIFRFDNEFTFTQFLNAYKDEPVKIFVIDSAEKLAELPTNDILTSLIKQLKENNWHIIFTTRNVYLNDLIFHIRESYQLSVDVIDVPLISNGKLISISKEFDFSLPENPKFCERLSNLFYLNEYINHYKDINEQGNLKEFRELLWKKRIQNTIQKDNLHLLREQCFISIAKKRSETGQFYINGDDLPQPALFQEALFQLKQDEILGHDRNHNGYFITHDIYEEWALDKIVSHCFFSYLNTKQFFDELGNTLPIRRAFRLWLSDQLSYNNKEIEKFIQDAFTNNEISQFWKDEILVSVLLSNYSETFFGFLEKEIIANDFEILKRILFLLRIACTDISTIEDIDSAKPRGKGWEEVIALIYKHESDFFDSNLKLILPVLQNWCHTTQKGTTTRYSGLLALSIIHKTKTKFYIHDSLEEKICMIVCNSANELQSELKKIFDKVIANKWAEHGDPYYGLYSIILAKPYLALVLIRVLPLHIIQLCNLFWQKKPEKHSEFKYDYDRMESAYGLIDRHELDYFPASANQTPIWWLLQIDFYETLGFIINFTNRAVESYSQSDYEKENVENITLYVNEKEITQYVNDGIWSMYRGSGSSVAPDILKSIHMALEKILLVLAREFESEIVQKILLRILIHSKSASLTSVVCSVVLAYPNKFYEIAIILFKTVELFHLDINRGISEHQAKSLYSMGYGMDIVKDKLYTDERLESCEDKHRNSNLEHLFLKYQFCGVEGFTEDQNAEFIGKLHKIIDQHKSNASTSKELGILLARMDRRNLISKVSNHDGNNIVIELSIKELPDELRKESEQASSQFEEFSKYLPLMTWANFLNNSKPENKNQKYEEYDKDPLLALSETKQLIKELESGQRTREFMDYRIPPLSCSKLMMEHQDILSKEDKDYCKTIILSTISRLFTDNYGYQIEDGVGDGVEASIYAIPALINEYPSEVENYISMMVQILFDEPPFGGNERIYDYLIESIRKSKLWEQNQNIAQSILFGYIKLKPLYENIKAERRKEKGDWGQIPKSAILEELYKTNIDFTFLDITFDITDIDSLDIHGLEIIYQLIPSNTKDKVHLDIYSKSLPLLAPQLLKDDSKDISNIYMLRHRILERFAYFILQRKKSEIDIYLKPFVDAISPTRETALFIEKLVIAEDGLNNYEQFWHIWDILYPKIKELCDNPRSYHLEEVVTNYLLASRLWREDAENWRSLKSDNLHLYSNASKDIGHIPSVLYSVVKVLNSIGTNFQEDGIDWIHVIVSNNGSLDLGDLESNTLSYLEKFLRKYIFRNRERIRKDIRLKNKIIPILDFMIERGSTHGYLLRESIL